MKTEFLILVDEHDVPLGKMEKMEVHEKGLLHRAFSVFIFNTKGELLLQQRADGKYHSGGLWTNTCCSHPNFGEEINDAVKRRLIEEMGLSVPAEFAFSFIYRIAFNNGLTEHEFDHVFVGVSDTVPNPDPSEVKAWKYAGADSIRKELAENPALFTEWFRLCFDKVIRHADIQKIIGEGS
jgi:isopentenyl-diphosphate Delta-isomerase